MFTEAQKHALIGIARAAVTAEVTGIPRDVLPAIELPEASGAFVTLKRYGQLRGCLGTLECRQSLAAEIAQCAVNAARRDPRFSPVTRSELVDLDFEVSILGPLEPIDPHDEAAVVIGQHGLVVEQGRRRGVLLPQVAVEWGWTPAEFLAQVCRKAGLPLEAWENGASVYRFEAVVFGG
jgi:AmmeMemoRadiSam system protein A